jgi:hypothetical protein
MIRMATSYILTSIVLLSQIGLPVHFHYCKGILESVSVFISQGCDDHEEIADLPACCKKLETSHCTPGAGDCCDDKVSILIQEVESLIPHFAKWDVIVPAPQSFSFTQLERTKIVSCPSISGISTDTGPPIYILHQSLIFYA